MKYIEKFIQEHIDNNIDFKNNPLSIQIFTKSFRKGKVITEFGQIEKRGYYLIEGTVLCIIDDDGEDKVIDIILPDSFFSAYNSYLLDAPSDIKVLASTDCKVEYFEKENLKKGFETSLTLNKLGRYLKEKFFLDKLEKEKTFLTKTSEEIYLEILNTKPEIVKHIPVKRIAQYLGIHPESLSRIRKKLT